VIFFLTMTGRGRGGNEEVKLFGESGNIWLGRLALTQSIQGLILFVLLTLSSTRSITSVRGSMVMVQPHTSGHWGQVTMPHVSLAVADAYASRTFCSVILFYIAFPGCSIDHTFEIGTVSLNNSVFLGRFVGNRLRVNQCLLYQP
jgi:hypothetical protein